MWKSWIEKNLPTIYLISFLFCILTVICTAVQWRGDFNAWVQTRRFACETVNLSNKFQFSSEMIDECPNSFGCLMPLFYLSLSTTHWGKSQVLVQKSQFWQNAFLKRKTFTYIFSSFTIVRKVALVTKNKLLLMKSLFFRKLFDHKTKIDIFSIASES